MATTFGQYGKHRVIEIIPGALVWLTVFLAIFCSFFAPAIAVVFIILFDLYWAMRVLYFLIHLLYSYRVYQRVVSVNWREQSAVLDRYRDIWHVVMLPTYQEGIEILRDALQSIAKSDYPNDRFIVIVGGEEGDAEQFTKHQRVLQKEFKGVFAELLFSVHPRGLKGEIPGKGSNMAWMAKEIQKYLDGKDIAAKNVLVSAFDSDTIAHEQYFGRLTYLYLTEPNPMRSSYQPFVLYSNNMWQASAPVRIASFGTTFFLLSEFSRPDRMWTFSSHSMPWQMLVDVGFWETDLVSEDSRIFMQGLLRYDGDYRVTPMYLPVSMDAVSGAGVLDSCKALYKQQRRWAWGVEHLPYMIEKFKERPNMPRRIKLRYLFNHMEGMYTWATAPILIFVLGYLPFWAAGDETTALMANSPFTLERMMQIATIGVLVTGFLSFFLLPHRPEDVKRLNWVTMILQWALLPVTFILFSALPAIDAQTRFMLGKYLGFNVTKKSR